jgi:hypothetical protein
MIEWIFSIILAAFLITGAFCFICFGLGLLVYGVYRLFVKIIFGEEDE